MTAAPNADQLRTLVKQGKAMPAPNQDRPGRFYIRNAADLDAAVRAVGRVQPQNGEPVEQAQAKVRRFIIKCAKQMALSARIPDTWNADGSLKS
jgi:hypothetical protein